MCPTQHRSPMLNTALKRRVTGKNSLKICTRHLPCRNAFPMNYKLLRDVSDLGTLQTKRLLETGNQRTWKQIAVAQPMLDVTSSRECIETIEQ